MFFFGKYRHIGNNNEINVFVVKHWVKKKSTQALMLLNHKRRDIRMNMQSDEFAQNVLFTT